MTRTYTARTQRPRVFGTEHKPRLSWWKRFLLKWWL